MGRKEGEEKHCQELITETPPANPINLLILLFLAPGYVFLANTESIWAKHSWVSGVGNVFSCCQKAVTG